jgi:hypothetical protein
MESDLRRNMLWLARMSEARELATLDAEDKVEG